MKLLASVLSVAAADYACCPYDDYGIPDSTCVNVLTEKSPFGTSTGALVPQESYACKAWEANAGASSEPHKGGAADDWGSCGFQRHFPWYHSAVKDGNDHLTTLGLWDAAGVAKYQVLATGGSFTAAGSNGNFNYLSLTSGSFSGFPAGNKPVVGEVHLGAICKLFVPVQKSSIRQVSVAGVHINNARIAGGARQALSTEFNAAVIGNIADNSGTHVADFHAGTAYCFSVVNIAEFMTNRANNIANANVAGEDQTARGLTAGVATGSEWFADDVGLKYDASGSPSNAQFGTIWPGYNEANSFGALAGTAGTKNSGQHKVNMGSNFDVVVHFETDWCRAHWNLVDMQKQNDHGEGTATGHLSGSDSTSFEGLMDAWDKRLPAGTGSCGLCYDKTSWGKSPNNGGLANHQCNNNRVGGLSTAGTEETLDKTNNMDYNTNNPGTCNNINGYASDATLGSETRWPNAGAWAAFYSFITCARSDYMIYGPATRGRRQVKIDIAEVAGVQTPGANHLDETPEFPENPEAFNDGTFDLPNAAGDLSDAATLATNGNNIGNNDNRMVVVGGWHQDYRHGQGACVRFNLRQVGNNVEYCADGDEERFNGASSDKKNPTGDTSAWSQNGPKRCTWNWNYNILSSGGKSFDAEAWFDSVDPLHKQMWPNEAFIDEPAPGVTSSQASGYAAAVGTLTHPLRINLLIQDTRDSTTATAKPYVGPTSLEFDAPTFVTALPGGITTFPPNVNGTTTPTKAVVDSNVKVFDYTSAGTYATVTVSCSYTASPSVDRNNFPDCFFGDEIHGQWVWNTGLQDRQAASGTSVWKFWAMIKNHAA